MRAAVVPGFGQPLCQAQQNTGYSVDGCYAEYFLAEAAFATPVPVGVDPLAAAR